MIIKGILRAWDAGTWTASVEPVGVFPTYLTAVPVARNIPNAEMTLGRYVAVETFDAGKAQEAVVIAVWT